MRGNKLCRKMVEQGRGEEMKCKEGLEKKHNVMFHLAKRTDDCYACHVLNKICSKHASEIDMMASIV